jgi:germination protein M
MRRLLVVVLLLGLGAIAWWWLRQPPSVDETPVSVEDAQTLGTRSVTLYFALPSAEGVRGETRTIAAHLHRDEEVEAVIAQLLAGPDTRGLISAIPDGTRLWHAYFDDAQKLVYLDFSQELVAGLRGGSASELMVLTSLLRTLAVAFPDIESAQILVDGLEVETLAGHIDLTRPLHPGDWL